MCQPHRGAPILPPRERMKQWLHTAAGDTLTYGLRSCLPQRFSFWAVNLPPCSSRLELGFLSLQPEGTGPPRPGRPSAVTRLSGTFLEAEGTSLGPEACRWETPGRAQRAASRPRHAPRHRFPALPRHEAISCDHRRAGLVATTVAIPAHAAPEATKALISAGRGTPGTQHRTGVPAPRLCATRPGGCAG